MKNIWFKSTPENWRKEYLGLKCNTIRKLDKIMDGVRKEILDDFVDNKYTAISVEIINTKTEECFSRIVSDVTKFRDMYIISWRPK